MTEKPTTPENSLRETQVKRCSFCHAEILNDDIAPKSGMCEKCERSPERRELFNAQSKELFHVPVEQKAVLEQLALDPELEGRFLTDIHRTIKNDDVVVCDTLHAGLSAYLDPFNLAHKAKSGAGKTYDTVGTIEYYPEEDVVIIGSQSPKVISHDYGELMTLNENGEETPLNLDDAPIQPKQRSYDSKEDFNDAYGVYKIEKRKWDQKIKNSFHLIRLAGKIYVFLDTISLATFEMFKCTLSHDKPRIIHKFVDERGKVHTTVLEGWPSAIFCTVDKDFLEEFATRTFTDTPETTTEKIQAAQEVIDNKRSFPWEYEEDTKEKKLFKALIRNIRDTVKKYNLKTVMPFPNLRNLIKFSKEATRDMRDYQHFNQMLPTYTAFKLFQRPIITIGKQKYIVESVEDVLASLDLFDKIAETTRTGTEKPILDFYHNHVQHHKEGAILKVLLDNAPEMRSERTARYYLARLDELGWVNTKEGEQADKRLLTYYPLKDAMEAQQKLIQTTVNQRNTIDLKLELEKDFNVWFKTITTAKPDIQIEKINFNDRTLESITVEELKKLIGIQDSSVVIVSNEANKPNPETEAETKAEPLITVVLPKSTTEKTETEDSRCCGDCGRFHLASCWFPNGNFETVPVDWYAGECRGFIPKQPEMPGFNGEAS